MKITYTEKTGIYNTEMIALYNKNQITEQEVRTAIKAGIYNRNIITMTVEQYENVLN